MSKIDVLNVDFHNITMDEAVSMAYKSISEHKGAYIVTPNPEIVMEAQVNPALAQALHDAYLTLPDGIGIIHGARILGTPMKEKIPGIDFASKLMEQLSYEKRSVYLFGAKPGVADLAAEHLKEQYPGLVIAGTANGYFDDDKTIIDDINRTKPDLLLVCLGVPKQEIWMHKNMGKLDVGLMAGLGGSLDVFAGVVHRAPAAWQKLGLEWLYRLIKQPSRFKRMLKLPVFLICVIKKRVKK